MSVSTLPWATVPAVGNAIALYARATPELAGKVEAALQRLRDAHAKHGAAAVQSSSLGVEDMVITDLIARAELPIDIATLDTGRLHAETLALIPRIRERYGRQVAVFTPVADKFTGAIRARGEVLVDMMQLLARTGFDEVVLRGDQSQAAAQKALDLFAPVGFYQGDVAETRPWFLRSAA